MIDIYKKRKVSLRKEGTLLKSVLAERISGLPGQFGNLAKKSTIIEMKGNNIECRF